MIHLEVIDIKEQHFCLFTDEPLRVEISVVNGKLIAFVYEGTAIDKEQEPLGVYDGTIGAEMGSWKSDPATREPDMRNLSV